MEIWYTCGHLVNFTEIWYTLWPFWYSVSHFGMLHQEKSGNSGVVSVCGDQIPANAIKMVANGGLVAVSKLKERKTRASICSVVKRSVKIEKKM
jgi:hypothetical protein